MGSDHPNALDFSDLCRFKNSIFSLAGRASGDCQLLDAKIQLLSLRRQSAKPLTRKKSLSDAWLLRRSRVSRLVFAISSFMTKISKLLLKMMVRT